MRVDLELVDSRRKFCCFKCGKKVNAVIVLGSRGKKFCGDCASQLIKEVQADIHAIDRKLFGIGGA